MSGPERLRSPEIARSSYEETVVFFGDSITGRGYDSPDSVTNQYNATGYSTWLNILQMQRLLIANESGVSGDSTALALARIYTDVTAFAPKRCVVMLGINDVVGGVALSTSITNLSTIYRILLSRGIYVVACTVLPSTQVNTDLERTKLDLLNNFIRDTALSTPGMTLADTYAAWVDYSNGDPVSTMVADGTHPTYVGAVAVARALSDVFSSILPSVRRCTSNYSKFGCGFLNPMAYGDNAGGANGWTLNTGMTGQGPNNWVADRTGTATGVCSKVARASTWRQGDLLQVAHTGGSANNRTIIYPADIIFQAWSSGGSGTANRRIRPTTYNGCNYLVTTGGSFAAGADPTASWSTVKGATVTDGTVTMIVVDSMDPGEKLYGSMEFEADSFSGGATLRLKATCFSASYAGTLYSSYGNFVDGTYTNPTYVPANGVLRTPEFVVPASTMIFRLAIECFSEAAVTGNYRVTAAEIRKQPVSYTFTR